MKESGRARLCREPRRLSSLLVALACSASTGLAGTVTVGVNLDSIAAQVPKSDTAGPASSSRQFRLLVPIPRLCRVASDRVTLRRPQTDSYGRSVVLSSRDAVEVGKAFAAFDVGPGVAGQIDISINYEPLPAAQRPARESLLFATCGEQADGFVLLPAEYGSWYPDEDTSLAAFYGGRPPEGFDFRELSRMPLKCDAVIVVCTGGWGRVPLEHSDDIAPTAFAMRDSMASWGLSALVVPYLRLPGGAPENPVLQLTEMFGAHHKRSREFANTISILLRRYPGTSVVLVGLSNGATFVGQAMSLLGPEAQSRVSVFEFGPPWWNEDIDTPNTLVFDNEGGDPVATCKLDIEVAALFSGVERSLWAQLIDRPVPFSRAVYNPAHGYEWQAVGSSIVSFLRSRLGIARR
jgi:hypothetical protein